MRLIIFIFSLCLLSPACVQAETEKVTVSTGWGGGYGRLLGVNASYRLIPKIDLLGAVGVDDRWSVGFRYQLTKNNRIFQPRIAIIYGTNAFLDSKDTKESLNGFSIGAGARLGIGRSKRSGIDLDVYYRLSNHKLNARKRQLTSEGKDFEDSIDRFLGPLGTSHWGYNRLQISLGYSFKF